MENDQDFRTLIEQTLNEVNRETREKMSKIMEEDLFVPVYDLSIRNQKELAQRRLKRIVDSKVVSVRDFVTNPENIFTMHEMVLLHNSSLLT